MSQNEKLIKALKEHPEGLTGMQIILSLGILNYKGRIHDLRTIHGGKITTERIVVGEEKKTVALYKYKE
ncbi:MAG: helix-turn-helix domain-containing protein [Bacteroidales bacterium]|jgi:hypothetical protein|nr:helix-turn-helix domain-containing protein [Bacteroidales bacterium]